MRNFQGLWKRSLEGMIVGSRASWSLPSRLVLVLWRKDALSAVPVGVIARVWALTRPCWECRPELRKVPILLVSLFERDLADDAGKLPPSASEVWNHAAG
jgi:hypothetical protein